MTKEQFIEQMTVIEDYLAARRKAGDMLNNTFFKGSTPSVFDFSDELMNLAIDQLSELSGVNSELVEWFLCENRGKWEYIADGFSMDIKTSADLWDFEQHDPNK